MDFSLQQCELFGGQEQDSPYGKTSLESSATIKGEALLQWLEKWQGYTLTYRKVDGETPVFSSAQMPLSSGQFWMRNSSEFRSGAVASSLSEILETGPVDRRYFLSPKACKGILRRAANRGKSLPPSLREALEAVASDQTSTVMGGGAIEVCMSTGQGSAEIGIGTTLNCNHESPIIAAPLTQNPYADNESRDSLLVTHSLSADGFDASEDGTGRGTPLVPIAYRVHGENSTAMTSNGIAHVADPVDTARSLDSCGGYATNQGGNVILQPLVPVAYRTNAAGQVDSQGMLSAALTSQTDPCTQFIAFSRKDSGSHANAGGQVAIAIQERAICENPLAGPDGVGIRTDDQAYTVEARQVPQAVAFVQNTRNEVRLMGGDGQIGGALSAEPGMKQQCYVAGGMAVRRLTPRECERLQGVPDGYTLVERNGKLMADGPRYKMLGNGFAVPVARWIGERLAKAVK